MTHSEEEVKAAITAIETDMNMAVKKLNSAGDEFDFYARAYVRAMGTWVEGVLWLHKTIITQYESKWHEELPMEDQLYLFESDWEIRSGKPVRVNKKIATKQNLKSFFHVAAKIFQDYSVDLGGQGWQDILYFFSLRDRLMHPSGISSLIFSREDLDRCDNGRIWLRDQFSDLREEVLAKLDA